MREVFGLICDHASDGGNGKVNILGVFSSMYSEKIPLIAPHFSLIVQWEFKKDELGAARRAVAETRFVTPSGKAVFMQKTDLVAGGKDPRYNLLDPRATMILNLQSVPFTEYGVHRFEVNVNGQPISIVPLTVVGGTK